MFAFNANFDGFAASADQVAIQCLLRFPPEDEIYFTVFIKSDLQTFRDRLEEMRAAGTSKPRGAGKKAVSEEDEEADEAAPDDKGALPSPDILSYTDNSKNVKGYIAKDGHLYLRNKGYFDTMPADLSVISKPIVIDKVAFAIWPPAASASRGLLAREFIGYLGNLIGRERVHELRAWADAAAR